ncbi:MAG: hypothetical protein COW01_00035 [Bdellovibrionales bacterium CG12_big_fil_rev_8_21_14_0_65_38_15]|nr:MAG: hypothetical protein COW79_15785 [Bdellovibrionales bacterium CG22_combo_CG10-13_8_21_14_all_38_13]PIQ57502.1 MAG: hypothetical protein COW01_00035 [Bdellovibrionales bacterium CG12_big_fil_rev_8_21_14_0_65_38_15]
MKYQTEYIPSQYRVDYLFEDHGGPVYICLHGYGQSGDNFYSLIKSALPENSTILVPNGPYPLPGKARTIECLGFAWYFYDSKSQQYYVPYDIPANIVKDLIDHLNLTDRKKIIIGYSQGGYLAPFLAQELTALEKVICINSSFRPDMMKEGKEDFKVHAISGADDDMVNPIEAKKKHEQLSNLNREGDFKLLENTNHRINDEILRELKNYLV